jgi:hypothetical protein
MATMVHHGVVRMQGYVVRDHIDRQLERWEGCQSFRYCFMFGGAGVW